MTSDLQRLVAFTTTPLDGAGCALALFESFSRHHPEVPFWLALSDSPDDLDTASFPVGVLSLAELGIPDIRGMAARLSVAEFDAAIRPFVYQALFDRYPGASILYLDASVLVTSHFDELFDLLAASAECVLTPAITEPSDHETFDDQQILAGGAYDSAFCCLADRPTVRRMVWWWARRMVAMSLVDPITGASLHQRWMDLFPAFIEGTRILRHPGYNVAAWNLHQRRLSRVDGHWSVNGEPLRYVFAEGTAVSDEIAALRPRGLLGARNVGPEADLAADLSVEVMRRDLRRGDGSPVSHSSSRPALPPKAGAVIPSGPRDGDVVPYLPVMAWRSRERYAAWASRSQSILEARHASELADVSPLDPFELAGECVICGTERSFVTSGSYTSQVLPDGRTVPNWREHLVCPGCGFNNRQRASYHLMLQEVRPPLASRIYLTEFVTGYPALLARRFPLTTGSEYLGPEHGPGQLVDGVPHEDLQALSFEDGSLDVILSFDVLEHVPDERMAFSEMARCLQPGGTLLMTAPTRIDHDDNSIRAVMSASGEVTHILEPEYHGNPINPEMGSLCYRYFGWQVLDQLKEAGFRDAQLLTYWSRRFRYYGDPQLAILAVR